MTKRRSLYSGSRPAFPASAREESAEPAGSGGEAAVGAELDAAQPARAASPARMAFASALGLARKPAFLASAALVVALGLLVYSLFSPRPRKLTQKDIDDSVEFSLANRQADPSAGALAFEAIRPSLVKVRQLSGEGSDAEEIGTGSGIVIADTGLILTNYHVIRGAPSLSVVFFDGSESAATVVSADPDRDLAMLQARVIPDDLQPATLRSVAGLSVGDPVYAAGYPFGIGPSFSEGVVSGLDRGYVDPAGGNLVSGLIQFDAAANPGNSGGPLVDKDGAVVGIVTFILNPTKERVFIGIGFALPIESAAAGFVQNPF